MKFTTMVDVDVFYNLSFELIRIPFVDRPEFK